MLSEVKWMLIEGMVCHDSLDIFIMEWKKKNWIMEWNKMVLPFRRNEKEEGEREVLVGMDYQMPFISILF